MRALASIESKLIGRLSKYLPVIILLSALFITVTANAAFAETAVTVISNPEKRGSITPGLDNILMQSLSLRTSGGTAQFTAIKLNEFGTADASATVSSVDIYKETNSVGGLQVTGAPGDTVLSTSPAKFSAEEQAFTFAVAETITDTSTMYYIVYEITTDTPVGTTVGSRLVDNTYVTVNAPATVNGFSNLQSRELTLVAIPHGSVTSNNPSPFSATTNLCQMCHAVHMAPDFSNQGLTGENASRRILTQPYFESPAVVNANKTNADLYNALCLTCHDGTGAGSGVGSNMDIKSKYNDATVDWPGHKTKNSSTVTTGWKAPPSGQQYDSGVKIPCMVCHDVHASSKGNYKMLADGLVDYAKSVGWQEDTDTINNRIDNNDEKCLVCHRRSNETTRTANSTYVMGIEMSLPASHDTSTSCMSTDCHDNPHALDKP